MKDYSELTRGKEKRLANNSGFYIKEFYIMELGHYGHREKEWLHPTASKIVYYNDTNQDSQYIFYKREQLIMYSSISGRDSTALSLTLMNTSFLDFVVSTPTHAFLITANAQCKTSSRCALYSNRMTLRSEHPNPKIYDAGVYVR